MVAVFLEGGGLGLPLWRASERAKRQHTPNIKMSQFLSRQWHYIHPSRPTPMTFMPYEEGNDDARISRCIMNWTKFTLFVCLPITICSFHAPVSLDIRAGLSPCTDRAGIFRRLSSHSKIQRANQVANDDYQDKSTKSAGLYVHIPFCRRRCNYCDFAIVPIGIRDFSQNITGVNSGFEKMNQNYTNALLMELNSIAESSISKIPLRSIYFGGGTPSLAPLSTLRKIMDAICKLEDSPFQLEKGAEVTIEMDPGTFDLKELEAVKDMGFNRISLGVQSFDDVILNTLGRVHRSLDVYKSIELISKVYGEEHANYSIDLISGIPGLTLAGWTETLYNAVRLHPRPLHISLYDLQVERGTAFWKWYNGVDNHDDEPVNIFNGNRDTSCRPALPSAEVCAWMYRYASGYLRSKNYEHYEISSYSYSNPVSKETHRSKHNQIYWEVEGQWYAIGLGATSNLKSVRFGRPRALSNYISWASTLKSENTKQISSNLSHTPPWLLLNEDRSKVDELLDIIMTRLRTSDGLDLDWIIGSKKYNEFHVEAILRGFELALELDLGMIIKRSKSKYGVIRLSDPNGFLFSNNIISNIFVELDSIKPD